MQATTVSISINARPDKIYKFVSAVRNGLKWGKTQCRSVKKAGGKWIMETPQGPVGIRIAKRNSLGILDHYIKPVGRGEVLVPIRVVPNGQGSEVIFTVFRQPWLSAKSYAGDIELVMKDLKCLKKLMEK
jgi:hypothetical protein